MTQPFNEDLFRDAAIAAAMMRHTSREKIASLCSVWPEFRGGLKRYQEYESWIASPERKSYRHRVSIVAAQVLLGD